MEKVNFYSFSGKLLEGDEIEFSSYAGKVVLVVNTASKCGFTPQYKGLEQLYRKFKDRGLVILGFPCNQFGNQEPGDAKSIKSSCLLNYGVSFQIFEKTLVKGPEAHPLFKWLIECLPGIMGKNIKWNFTKFLIDANGNPYKRYSPTTKPESIVSDIEQLISEVK